MKRIAVPIALSLILGACGTFSPLPNPQPTVDTQASSAAQAGTISAMTLAALSTPTVVPATETETPILLPSPAPTDTDTPTPLPPPTDTPVVLLPPAISSTSTAIPAFTATGTGSVSTATFVPTLTPIGGATATATFGGHQTYGTLPPKVPSNDVRIINKSKAQAYVSLQCTNRNKQLTIIEYSVRSAITLDVPKGPCIYVAWVGGRKFVGSFSNENIPLTMTLYLDKITMK